LLLLRQQVSCKPCCFGYADLRRLCPAAIWFAERYLPSSSCSLSYIDSAKPLTHGTKRSSSRDKLSVLERDTLASKPPTCIHVCAKEKQKGKENTSATTHTLHTRNVWVHSSAEGLPCDRSPYHLRGKVECTAIACMYTPSTKGKYMYQGLRATLAQLV